MGKTQVLSEREKQVAEQLRQGKSNKEIALVLGISVRTVEFHLSHLFAKLGVASRTEAAVLLAESDLRETPGIANQGSQVESTVDRPKVSFQNDANIPETRRNLMQPNLKKILSVLLILLVLVVACPILALLIYNYSPARQPGNAVSPISTIDPVSQQSPDPSAIVSFIPDFSPRASNLIEVQRLAAEYDEIEQASCRARFILPDQVARLQMSVINLAHNGGSVQEPPARRRGEQLNASGDAPLLQAASRRRSKPLVGQDLSCPIRAARPRHPAGSERDK